jgi:ligand-binding sensor domain-containing protein
MNRSILVFIIVTLVTFLTLSCEKEDKSISITELTVSSNRLALDLGKSDTLEVMISPPNATNQTLIWSSSDTTIAKVSAFGVVTGIGAGIDTIKVTTTDGNLISTCIVTIMKWTNFASTNSDLVNDTILSTALDNQGNKWFGTYYGVSKFDGSNWTTYNTSNSGLLNNWIFDIYIDNQDNKWFGNEYGMSKFNGANWTNFTPISSGLSSFPVNAIAFDAQGNEWIGTANGISKFDGANWTTYNTTNSGLVNDIIITIIVDVQGNIWFGTGGGVSRFDGTNWMSYTRANGLAGNGINAIVIDTYGNMWFGTSDGLSKFNGTNWTSYFINTQINAVAVDKQGYLWVSRTYEFDGNNERISSGVSKFDGENWTTFNTSNSGLINNTVTSIDIDANDNKWFGTLGGISEMQD